MNPVGSSYSATITFPGNFQPANGIPYTQIQGGITTISIGNSSWTEPNLFFGYVNPVNTGSGVTQIQIRSSLQNVSSIINLPSPIVDPVATPGFSYSGNVTGTFGSGSFDLGLIGIPPVLAYDQMFGTIDHVMINTSSPPPTLLQLAQASQNVYSGNVAPAADKTSGAYHFIGDDCGVTSCFTGQRAAVYASADGSQVIVSVRGTASGVLGHDLKDALSDESFVTGSPTPEMQSEVSQVAAFVKQIQSNNPNATITLTGHSLGGAVAQMIGKYTGLNTDTFNAPGSGQLYGQLQPELSVLNSGSGGTVIDYRIYGDQYGQFGNPLTEVSTVTLPYTQSNALVDAHPPAYMDNAHEIQTVLTQINAYENGSISSEASPGPNIVFALEARYLGGNIIRTATGFAVVIAGVVVAGEDIFFDPSNGSDFTFLEKSGSPNFSCVTLPAISGVASYNISSQTDAGWSGFQNFAIGEDDCFGAGTTGIDFRPLDANGQGVDIQEPFIFSAKFSSSGQFSGVLTENDLGAAVPEPSTYALLGLSFGVLGAVLRSRRASKRSQTLVSCKL